ncbi:hypothetical protein D9M69_513850 [compost metagenome]
MGTKGVGLPLSYTTFQYFGARRAGLCFSQYETGWQTQRPATLDICAGRQCSHDVDREGTLFASSRRDQQTEQSQLSAWARRR